MAVKFGRKKKTEDKRDLLLKNYLTVLPPIPPESGHETDVPANDWDMLGNGPDPTVSPPPDFQGAGNCVIAAGGHETKLWTAEGTGTPVAITGEDAIQDYIANTDPPYNPVTGANDTGCEIRDVLKYRQQTGLLDANGVRHKIGAYLALNMSNLVAEIEASIYLFGAVEIGVNFPQSAMDQFNAGQEWTVVANDGGIIGGHDVPLVAWRGTITCVTWAQLQQMNRAWLLQYCEEAWAILSPEMLNGDGDSPEGFDLAQLQADLTAIQNATPTPAGNTATATLTLTVTAAPLVITTTDLPSNEADTEYTVGLQATGGVSPYTWTGTGIPSGLTLSTAGILIGTPTTEGTYSLDVTVTDSENTTASATLTLVITAAPVVTPEIVTTSLPAAQVNQAYSAEVSAAGGVIPYTWTVTGLPPGLVIDSGSGVISGTPTAAGVASVVFVVTDSAGASAKKGLA